MAFQLREELRVISWEPGSVSTAKGPLRASKFTDFPRFHKFSQFLLDFRKSSSVAIDLPKSFVDFHLFALLFVDFQDDYHCFSLIFIGLLWFSLIFKLISIDFVHIT